MKLFIISLLAATGLACNTTVSAAAPLEEVVVTAGFRDSPLLHSAGSISVMDSDIIDERAARHLGDTLNVLPNVNFSSGGSRARFIQVRGVGDLEQFVDPKHYPSVGVMIDGIEVGTTANAAVLTDVRQIELLRGPQGTRFGASALAGIININSNDPGKSLNGGLEAGYGNYDSWHVRAVAGGPLTDSLGARLAVQQTGSDGYMDNDFLAADDTNGIDELSLHGKVLWQGNDRREIRVTGIYLNADNGYDAFSLDNSRTTLSDTPGRDEQQTRAVSMQGNWPLTDDLLLETQISWAEDTESYGFDEDWVFSGFCDAIRCDPLFEFSSSDDMHRERDRLTLDLRLESEQADINWVGGFYLQLRDEQLQRRRFGSFNSDYDTERYAVYGQVEYTPSPDWSITAGIRVEHFRDGYNDSVLLHTTSSDTYWSGGLTMEYLLSDATLIYATLSRGVKPGGVNTETSSNQPFMSAPFQPFLASRLQFAAEKLHNREVGIKSLQFDDRLAVRLALFHMARNNAQLESWVFDPATFIWTGMLDSNSDAENYGLELELDFRLTEPVSLFANVGYLETNVDRLTVFDLDRNSFVERTDRDQAKAPRWQYNLGMRFDLLQNLHGRIEVEGREESLFGYYHDGSIDAYTLVNASLALELGNTRLQGWVRNLFDQDYHVHGLYFANDPRNAFTVNRSYYQFGQPRAWGFTVTYSF